MELVIMLKLFFCIFVIDWWVISGVYSIVVINRIKEMLYI